MRFSQLLPEPRTVEVEDLLASIAEEQRASPERPYTLVNFVSSADGRTTFAGRSGALGDDGDQAMFHGLRERADAVLAGTVTMRTEGYGRLLGRQERRQRRADQGLPPEPLACVVTRGAEIPGEIPLFAEADARIVVFSSSELEVSRFAADVTAVRIDPGEFTLTTVLRQLRANFGISTLLCEGGPTLFGALLQERLVDELFLTFAPKLTGGGSGPAITAGPELASPQNLELRWLLERQNSLYLRYAVTQVGPVRQSR